MKQLGGTAHPHEGRQGIPKLLGDEVQTTVTKREGI